MRPRFWFDSVAAKDPSYRRYVADTLLEHRRRPPDQTPDAPGHVVEFVKGGRHACGVLLRKGGKHHQVLDVDGKRDAVDPAKVMDISMAFVDTAWAKHDRLSALRDMDRQREKLKTTVDLAELWEVVESEGQEWTLDELADLYFVADPGPHGKAALFRALEEKPEFHRHGMKFVPSAPGRLAAGKQEERASVRADAWLHEAAEWLRAVADGKEATRPEKADHAVELLAGKVLFGPDHSEAKEAASLAKLAHFHGPQAIFDVLVKLGHWDRDENLDLLRHEVPIAFPDEAAAEAEAAQWPEDSLGHGRIWFRRVYAPPDSVDRHERAFSVRRGLFGFTVGVHIASPTLVMGRGGAGQGEAADRGAAIRLPECSIPMLPPGLTDSAAIVEDELRPTLTVHLRVDRRYRLKRYRIEICSARVNRTVPSGGDALEQDGAFRKLFVLAQHLRKQRIADGAAIIPGPEVEPRVEAGGVKLVRTETASPLQLIDHELTVLANSLVGSYCKEHALPGIHRAEDPCAEIVVEPEQNDPVACYRQKRLMPKARLQTEPEPHHGVGADRYVPVTQPYERYTDLLMHQQLVAQVLRGQPAYTEGDLKEALLYTAYSRMTAHEIELAARRYWLLRYLEGQVGQQLDGVVLEAYPNACRVGLDETLLTAFCPVRRRVTPGARVRVRLVRASARGDVLRVAL